MNIKVIAREFEDLLSATGIKVDGVDYFLLADKEHGVGIFPENEQTKVARRKISDRDYDTLLSDLMKVAEDTEYGQGYNLRRDQILCE